MRETHARALASFIAKGRTYLYIPMSNFFSRLKLEIVKDGEKYPGTKMKINCRYLL